MKTTKIDWCDSTINPVVGCKNKCRYCYARKLNARFGFIKSWEEPQFFPNISKKVFVFLLMDNQELEEKNKKGPKPLLTTRDHPEPNYIVP